MPELTEMRSADRHIVHCLRCYKPHDNLSVHLARVCMKTSTSEECVEELQKAKASSKEWTRNNRTWTYGQLCDLLPHRRSRITLVKELLQRGFFILNLPQESEMVLEPEDDAAATTVTSSRDPPTTLSSERIKMREAGLHRRFPVKTKFLVGFKEFLMKTLKVPNVQQEVDSVSRFLRYMQPTGSKLSLDFLSKSTETRDLLTTLRRADVRSASILSYVKSIKRFLEYLTARRDLRRKIPQLRKKCRRYAVMLRTLRKTVSKTNEENTCDSRRCAEDAPGIKDCQQILQVAKLDFLRLHGDLVGGKVLSNTDMTLYRYYCEALLVYRHMQRPGAVEGLTDADWVERVSRGGRVVIGVRREKTASVQIALTKEEEALSVLQLYFRQIRPKNIGLEKFCRGFFVSSSSDTVHSVSQDMNRLHEIYKLAPFTSQDVRRAAGKAAQKLPAPQQEAVNRYLAHSAGAAQRDRTPQDVVDAAEQLDSLAGTSSDDSSFLAEPARLFPARGEISALS
ncbi:uncharacterized protein [Chanodichthys erythropterus]|uniref:uncharacterized protein isoform X1 n=1 Tax=Chanodichthys erythropterus TaxID=933992 RepID=UPI00351F3947